METKINIIFYVILGLMILYVIVYALGSFSILGVSVFPAFTGLSAEINYYLTLIFWIVLQIIVIFFFYKLFYYIGRYGIGFKRKLLKWSDNLRNLIVVNT